MRNTAPVTSVRSGNAHGFRWKRYAAGSSVASKQTLVDCVGGLQNAGRAGYTVAFEPPSRREQQRPA